MASGFSRKSDHEGHEEHEGHEGFRSSCPLCFAVIILAMIVIPLVAAQIVYMAVRHLGAN